MAGIIVCVFISQDASCPTRQRETGLRARLQVVTSWTSAFLHGFPLPTRATNANVSSRRVITKRSHPRRRVGGASTFVAVVVFHAVQRGDDIDDNVMEQSLHCNVTVALNRRICKPQRLTEQHCCITVLHSATLVCTCHRVCVDEPTNSQQPVAWHSRLHGYVRNSTGQPQGGATLMRAQHDVASTYSPGEKPPPDLQDDPRSASCG